MNNGCVMCSRVRFARNIKDYPFHSKLDKTSANEIIEKVGAALGSEYAKIDFDGIDEITALSNVENHKVSNEFIGSKLPHSLFEKGDVEIMVCEEDHIRLQCIKRGFCLEQAYKEAKEADALLLSKLNIAFDKKYGYLTHCPTNLGTAMRVSVMMFLPGIEACGEYRSISASLSKLGMTIRGIYGEGSDSKAAIYQISNTMTLGVDETAVIKKVAEIAEQIIEFEKKCELKIFESDKLKFEDKLSRALGILKSARLLDSSEFIEYYQVIRMGVMLGICNETDCESLDKLFIEEMPASLMKKAGRRLSERERDIQRAKDVREKLN